MNESSSKIIVAGGLAAVVGIGIVTYALRSHSPASVAQNSPPPAAIQPPAALPDSPAVAPIPAPPAAVAPTPAAPAAVAPTPAAPASVAHKDSAAKVARTASPAAVEPKVAGNRHAAKARVSADTNDVSPAKSTVNLSEKPAGETLAKSADGVKSVDEPTTPSAPSAAGGTTTFAQQGATSTTETAPSTAPAAASDSSITTEVKSQFAADNASNVNIGVTTTQGVVALSGTLATKDAIDHVKDVAGKVKDVKSVDTSAMKIASL